MMCGEFQWIGFRDHPMNDVRTTNKTHVSIRFDSLLYSSKRFIKRKNRINKNESIICSSCKENVSPIDSKILLFSISTLHGKKNSIFSNENFLIGHFARARASLRRTSMRYSLPISWPNRSGISGQRTRDRPRHVRMNNATNTNLFHLIELHCTIHAMHACFPMALSLNACRFQISFEMSSINQNIHRYRRRGRSIAPVPNLYSESVMISS